MESNVITAVPEQAMPEPPQLRSFMSGFPTGVSVVTTLQTDGEPRGMTCTSLCSVSLQPPIVSICFQRGSGTLAVIRESGRFSINLLRENALPTAMRFATRGGNPWVSTAWHVPSGAGGPHLTDDALGVADVVCHSTQTVGDHEVVFARVERVVEQGGDPLLYGRRLFACWSSTVGLTLQ